MSALPQIEDIANELHSSGFHTTTPVREEEALDWDTLSLQQAVTVKRRFLLDYFDTIRAGDAVLIVNLKKHGIEGYVGANTLMEDSCGAALGKPVFYLNKLGNQSCRLEALAVSSGVLNGRIGRMAELLAENGLSVPARNL
ncbi:hypothetical protein [Hoeflea sp.]|uniref:hypothetical protein n=1 Tax=Hoeflea sp. TaxID=1940281 RepID=UPI00374A030A